eukprot:6938067-Heterocapsa_arctica.AAC.1
MKFRAIAQVSASDRWDKMAIEELKGVPWNWSGETTEIAAEVFRDQPPAGIPDPDPPMPSP